MTLIKTPSHADWNACKRTKLLRNGERISYVEAGSSDGIPLVLLHGFGNSSRNWKGCFARLESGYHIYAVDEMGVGAGSCPDRFVFTIIEQAERVVELMDLLGVERFCLAGHSIGSYIAQAISFARPNRVMAAVLVSSFAYLPESGDDVIRSEKFYGEQGRRPDEHWYSERGSYPDAEGLEYQLEELKSLPQGYFRATWWGMTMADHRGFLALIKAPVLLIWGSADEGIPEEARQVLRNALPAARVLTYEGLGHEIVSRAPERLSIDIKEFLDKCVSACRR